MAVSKRLRYEILRRDSYTCRYCGRSAPEVRITVDHVVPTALGGSDGADNLVAACVDCNAGKSSSNPDAPLVEDVSDAAVRWGRAVAQAAQAMTSDVESERETQDAFLTVWERWSYGADDGCRHVPLDPNWKDSLRALLARGLPLKVINECVDIAMRRDAVLVGNKFKYFCGIAWRKVDELTDAAKAIYDDAAGSQLPDPAELALAPYRDAVHLLFGVVPDSFLDGDGNGMDGPEFRMRLAAEFDRTYGDDGDGKTQWPDELRALVAMVGRMRKSMEQEAHV